MITTDTTVHFSGPYSTFLVIHFEVGGDTKSLEYQESLWPAAINLVKLSDKYDAKLTLQFTPQWAEYIIKNKINFNLLKKWQKCGHEVALHHHGYDHGDWDGYTNRFGKENDPRFRGRVTDMMELMKKLVHPYQLLSGTITDEEFDYPQGIKYDTEGIQMYHAVTKPKRVKLGNNDVIQVGMAFLPFDGNIELFKQEYLKSVKDQVFGLVTHEMDFSENSKIIQAWFKFVRSRGENIKTVSEIITNYRKDYEIEYSNMPLTFLRDVIGIFIYTGK